ncbi:YncE family protein [Pseudomonas vanderleydeniana]|uniref:YncE family protein n=1 Tax=Pseudomonas vanderleydeniana TaxID=2745495 RepID=A0A9E6PFN2_9PSED|nr:YncE family protein [Pseudomonas vanderleydeniana]QXI25894.1 YncE family protein [Pseudomonas vanderleydeniana]
MNTLPPVPTDQNHVPDRAIKIIAHIEVGANPVGVVLHPNGQLAYVANAGANSVSVIDTTTQQVTRTITGLRHPWYLAIHPDGSHLYVGSNGPGGSSEAVSIVDLNDHSLVGTLADNQRPHGLATNLEGSILYVACQRPGFVGAYSTTAPYPQLATIEMDAAVNLALSHDGTRLYAIDNLNPGHLVVIDTASHQAISRHGMAEQAEDLACDPHRPRVYLSNQTGHTVSIVDTRDYSHSRTLNVEASPHAIAFNPVRDEAYVALYNNRLAVIDTRHEQVSATAPGFSDPRGLAVTADGSRAYVSNYNGRHLWVVAL